MSPRPRIVVRCLAGAGNDVRMARTVKFKLATSVYGSDSDVPLGGSDANRLYGGGNAAAVQQEGADTLPGGADNDEP